MTIPVGIGFIGGGMMMQVGHLPFYANDPRCEVVRVAESRPSLVAALSEQLGASKLVSDHRTILDDPSIHAVVISAPRPATGPLTLEALNAGKHVLAEKPMAHTVEQACRLVDAARSSGCIYAVGYMKRYDPGVQVAKKLVDDLLGSYRLGRMLLARFYNYSKSYAVPPPPHTRPAESRAQRFQEWPLTPDWLPARHCELYQWFLNSASHDVNLMRLMIPGELQVEATQCSSNDSIVVSLRTGDTPIVLEITNTAAGRWIEGAEFLFEKGRLAVALPSPMAVDRVSTVILDDSDGALHEHHIDTESGWSFQRQAQGFLDALTGGSGPLTSGADGLADMELTEAIWRRIGS